MQPLSSSPYVTNKYFHSLKGFFMKFRGPIFVSVLLGGFLFAAFYPRKAENAEKDAVLMQVILSFFDQLHFDPKKMDDGFSQNLYKSYTENLDASRRFLTQEDLKKLEVYKTQLDDEAKAGNFDFFALSLDLMDAGIKKTQAWYREILMQPVALNTNETYETDPEKRGFPKNDVELKELWRKILKFEVISSLADKITAQKKGLKPAGDESHPKTQEELEEEARKDVLKNYNDWYARLAKIKREDRLSLYFNTLTHVFDPHSDYLEPVEKQNFSIQFSGRLEGIGARLQSSGEYTKVYEIVVGGPAWKGKELQENDVIMKVAQGDDGPFIDVTGMVVNDVVQYVRGKKGTKVRLLVKKVDGSVKEIAIVRDVVEFEDNFAKSVILQGSKPDEKIGYIDLPMFYAEFDNPDGRFCARDIATELEKLKSENVNGIILDLRNNGGGSLRDVVRMSGFFIESGPIVQVKSRGEAPEVMRDVDNRVQYNGPLIVMVNSFSASASEILAAALQDYGRAIIVGSKSTFGKGTVQRFFNLDQAVNGYEQYKPLGDIKITIQKFYRINGGSTQLRGVTPDIILPDTYHYLPVGEREEEFPLEWTEIPSVAFSQNAFKIKNMEDLKHRSKMRIDQDPAFQKIYAHAKYLEGQKKNSSYNLGLAQIQLDEAKVEKESEDFKNAFKDVVNSGVRNPTQDQANLAKAEEKIKARNEDFLKNVSKDVYIRETLRIMNDLIANKL